MLYVFWHFDLFCSSHQTPDKNCCMILYLSYFEITPSCTMFYQFSPSLTATSASSFRRSPDPRKMRRHFALRLRLGFQWNQKNEKIDSWIRCVSMVVSSCFSFATCYFWRFGEVRTTSLGRDHSLWSDVFSGNYPKHHVLKFDGWPVRNKYGVWPICYCIYEVGIKSCTDLRERCFDSGLIPISPIPLSHVVPCFMLQDDAPETDRADGIPLWLHAAWQESVCVRTPLVWGSFVAQSPWTK